MGAVIGIGSSPLMLMRAVRLAEAGEVVTLLDRAAVAGGAWGAWELLGCANVEFGAHLLENRAPLYTTLGEGMGVPLEADPCVSLFRGRRLSMGGTRAGFHAAVGVRGLLRAEVNKLMRSWRTAARSALSGGPYFYPAGGASALVKALCTRLNSAGGRVEFGVTVNAIDVDAGGVRLATSAGERTTKRVIVSSRAFAPVSICGSPENLVVERGVCRNVVARLRGGGGAPFSYVEILADPRLKRVRDLSSLVRPRLESPYRMICVQHRRSMSDDAMADARVLADDLVRVGLLETAPVIEGAVRTDVNLTTLSDATLVKLERRSGGRIEALPTTDLAEGFMDRRQQLALSPGNV